MRRVLIALLAVMALAATAQAVRTYRAYGVWGFTMPAAPARIHALHRDYDKGRALRGTRVRFGVHQHGQGATDQRLVHGSAVSSVLDTWSGQPTVTADNRRRRPTIDHEYSLLTYV